MNKQRPWDATELIDNRKKLGDAVSSNDMTGIRQPLTLICK